MRTRNYDSSGPKMVIGDENKLSHIDGNENLRTMCNCSTSFAI